jgi:hypothetical protein
MSGQAEERERERERESEREERQKRHFLRVSNQPALPCRMHGYEREMFGFIFLHISCQSPNKRCANTPLNM